MKRSRPDRGGEVAPRERLVLVTGFERFGDEVMNPSQEVARQLHGTAVGRHHRVVAGLLPCVFKDSRRELEHLLRRHRPEIVICLGLAAGRSEITPERVAINIDDARIPDNAGWAPVDRPVVRGGPAAYWSTLPCKAIVAALRSRGIPSAVSQTAGTFVCNHVFYGLMHAIAGRDGARAMRGGFIHLPCMRIPGEKRPSLPLATLVEGIRAAVETAVIARRDVRAPGGAIS